MRRAGALLLANAGLVSAAHPVRMIVQTLQEMQKQLSTDSVEDKKLYDRMQCWCKKTMPQLNDAISKNRDLADSESTAAEAASGAAKKLAQEISMLNEKIATEQKNLEDANFMRSKDADAFNALQAELTQTISANQHALEVLSKHLQRGQKGVQGPVEQEFLQKAPETSLVEVSTTIKSSMEKILLASTRISKQVISPSQRAVLEQFLQQPTFGAHQSSSGQIIGILQSMLEEFQRDLSDETKAEEEASEAHSKLVSLKEKLIAKFQNSVAKKTVEQKKQEKRALEAAATAEQATKAVAADGASLEATTSDCQQNIKDYNQRTTDRANEEQAVQTAIEYLDSDEARDLFRDTADSFLQIDSSEAINERKRESARKVLQAAGLNNKDTKLLVLAQTLVRGGVFDKIIMAINELETELNNTKKNDQSEFDTCTGSINERNVKISELDQVISSEQEQIQNAADAITRLTSEIEDKDAEISTLETEMKDAGYLKEQATAKFVKDHGNNEAAVQLLDKTITALSAAYASNEALVQTSQGADGEVDDKAIGAAIVAEENSKGMRAETQEQTADFQKYEKHQSGNTVVTALEKIKNDIVKAQADAVAQESSEQESYGHTVQTLNNQINNCKDQRSSLKGQKAEEERIHQTTTESMEAHTAEHESESEALAAKKKSCRFIMENLDIRKTHMDNEITALQQAREFLKDQSTAQGA